jgi:Uma2 family endonuclease
MNAVATKTEYTPEDLLAMPDAERYELVNGVLVERHMGMEAAYVVVELVRRLGNHCHDRRLGWVLSGGDAGFQGFPNSPRTVRKPDVSFVSFGRFPDEILPLGYARLAPDLASEVVSPNDLYEDVDQKVEEYLRARVRLVWVISPRNRTVRVYRLDGSSCSLRENDELDGEDVLPGFRCRVGDLFPRPPAQSAGNGSGESPAAGQ